MSLSRVATQNARGAEELLFHLFYEAVFTYLPKYALSIVF